MRKTWLWNICIMLLLLVQGVAGLIVSLSLLAKLLAPGSPVIVTGINIFTGPIAGVSFAVALASLIVIWGWLTHRHWAWQRTLLIECISLVVSVFEWIEPHIAHSIPIVRVVLAVLILLCLLATRTTYARAQSHAPISMAR